MMGGALGLAILVALSEGRTTALLAAGTPPLRALNSGLEVAFAAGRGVRPPGRRGRRRSVAAATDAGLPEAEAEEAEAVVDPVAAQSDIDPSVPAARFAPTRRFYFRPK